MTRELSKTEKALRLIAKEGITAKEAAERVGISPAAVSKGRWWPSKAAQNVRKLCEMENEIEFLRSELATLTRQRDLAVEALKSCGVNDGLNGPTQYFDEDLVERAIKESEAK